MIVFIFFEVSIFFVFFFFFFLHYRCVFVSGT